MKNNKKMYKRILSLGILLILFVLNTNKGMAQASDIVPLDTIQSHHHYDTICYPNTITLGVIPPPGGDVTATYTIHDIPYAPDAYGGTNAFTSTYDDQYSCSINIGFTFCFMTNSYSTCLIGTNDMISFNMANACYYNQWPNNPIPSTNANLVNAVFCPWQDLYPPSTGLGCIKYQLLGAYPYRRFVVSWINVAYYSCTNIHTENQAKLYESTNVIEMLIHDKPVCTSWNGGLAVEGINNITGTSAQTVPGRNSTQWTVTTPECKQWIPDNIPPTITYTGPNVISSVTGPTVWSITVNPTVTSTYIFTLPYACASTVASDTFTVVIRDSLPTFTMTPDSCGNHVGTAIATPHGGPGPFTYSWTPIGGTNQTATGLGQGLYTCTVVDLSSGCQSSDTVTVDSVSALSATGTLISNVTCFGGSDGGLYVTAFGQGPFNYTWTPTGATTTTITNLTAGNYSCFIVNPNNLACMAHVYMTVTEPPVLTVITSPYSPAFCSYLPTGADTANVNGGTLPYAYLWSNGATDIIDTGLLTGTFIVTITDAHGCTASSASSVSIPFYLYISSSPDTGFCQGDSTQISVTVTGGYTPYAYSWNTFGANGNPTYVHPQITTNYIVTVTDAQGCTIVSTPINIHVNPTPNPIFLGEPIDGCIPLTVQFTDHSTCSQPIAKWKWNFGDGSNYSDSTSPKHTYTVAGLSDVTLIVTSSSGCSATLTDSAYIDAYPLPTARFFIDPTITSLLTPEINFTDRSQGADTVLYEFGDGTISMKRNVFHAYQDTGTYWITQTVFNNFGCADTISGTVLITPYYTFYIPNAFSPNTNGINDYFQPYGTGITEYSMDIFDRWGEKVFTTTNFNEPWDGKINGEVVLESSFIYSIKIKDYEKVAHEYFGKLTILR